MNNYFDAFRLNMKYYREQMGISQTKLSIICDCSSGTIGGIEAGKTKPSFDMIIKIAEGLKITPADLFVRDSAINKLEIKKSLKSQFDAILAKM